MVSVHASRMRRAQSREDEIEIFERRPRCVQSILKDLESLTETAGLNVSSVLPEAPPFYS
eukprot:4963603-Pleurochrysis_carterae.AAC.1